MENKNYTIKDIARMAGVSAGTVDRVLHNRGDVSAASLAKVQKVLDEIDYHPNMFAIGLAAKKPYRLICVIPHCRERDFWYTVEHGIKRAATELRPFNVNIDYLKYYHANRESYEQACRQVTEEEKVDAVLIAPNFQEETLRLTTYLEEKNIPYIYIDFNIENTNALCYIGQDSLKSGYVAAKILMRGFKPGDELAIFLNNQKYSPAEIQMQRRLEGFMEYIACHYDHLDIHDVVLSKTDDAENRRVLDDFFTNHPHAVLGAVFNSRVYQVANYLKETRRKMEGLIGYDLLDQNVEGLLSGEINFLIGQRPGLQSYYGIKLLCDRVVFKRPVPKVKYMPIDILLKENIPFYFELE